MLIVSLTHSGSAPACGRRRPPPCRDSRRAHSSRTGSPNSSVSPVVSPNSANSRTRPEERPWYLLLHAGVRDDEPAVVEHDVADQPVEEIARPRRGTPAARRSSCSSVSASPWVICTSRPLSLRTSLTSWLPGTQIALPAATMRHHQPQHARSVAGRGRRSRRRRPRVARLAASQSRRRRRPRSRARAAARRARRGSRGRRR